MAQGNKAYATFVSFGSGNAVVSFVVLSPDNEHVPPFNATASAEFNYGDSINAIQMAVVDVVRTVAGDPDLDVNFL